MISRRFSRILRSLNIKKRDMGKLKNSDQFGVIVICRDEKEQQEVYERLREQGLKLKVVCV